MYSDPLSNTLSRLWRKSVVTFWQIGLGEHESRENEPSRQHTPDRGRRYSDLCIKITYQTVRILLGRRLDLTRTNRIRNNKVLVRDTLHRMSNSELMSTAIR